MSDPLLTAIIKLCLTIDRSASVIYSALSKHARQDDLQSFWIEMSKEENQHVSYWEMLLHLAETGKLHNVFDNPQKTKAELEIVKKRADAMTEATKNLLDTTASFLLACRLEFYLMHPAFEALFHLMKQETGNRSPEDDYEAHIMKFIHGLKKFNVAKPEFELIIELISQMWQNNRQLAVQLANIRTLTGLIPICISCKKIRDDKGFWEQVESYISRHSEVHFTHGICPECLEKLYPKLYEKWQEEGKLQ